MGNKLSSVKISNPLLTLIPNDTDAWWKRVLVNIYKDLSNYTRNNIKHLNAQGCYLAKTLILNYIYRNLNLLIKEYNHDQIISTDTKNTLGLVELLQITTEGDFKHILDHYYDLTLEYYANRATDVKEKIKIEIWFHNETVKCLNWLMLNYQAQTY